MSKGTKHEFVNKLLAGTDFKTVNGIGMLKLPDGRVAKLELKTRGCSDHWEKLQLTVINKEEGTVDSTSFNFSEHLVPDKTNTHPSASFKKIEVIGYCGWDWYIDRPTEKSVKGMMNSITEYLEYLV